MDRTQNPFSPGAGAPPTEAIHFFYEFQSRKQQKKTAFDFLMETGFIGAVEEDERESVDYKKYVTERIRKKL